MTASASKKLVLLALSGMLIVGVTACSGGGADVQSHITTTTVGQQLIDLKKAYDSGAMTQQEYEQQRKKILNQN